MKVDNEEISSTEAQDELMGKCESCFAIVYEIVNIAGDDMKGGR